MDDHPAIRMMVRILLEAEGHTIIGEVDNGVDALSQAKDGMPDIIILDIGIPKLTGLEVIARLSALDMPIRILVLTAQSAALFSARCQRMGASGFVCKEESLTELIRAVQAVMGGYSYFPNLAFTKKIRVRHDGDETDLLKSLSDREMLVLQKLAKGMTNMEIAKDMLLSNKTVSTYKTRMQIKLDMYSLVELLEFAKRNRIV